MRVLVAGGAGFIGSAMVRELMKDERITVLNFDKLTYAGNLMSLSSIEKLNRYNFLQADICDYDALTNAINSFKPNLILNLAAESHVDRSIESPDGFIHTNIVGTFRLLQASLAYWRKLTTEDKKSFRFHHVSTDEVYGNLNVTDMAFDEEHRYAPTSPYSASKAASDHLIRAWHNTYGLPVIITNCSNNYGPYHFPEKFIPHIIISAILQKPLPVYGNGLQVRDWLYVEDHARAILIAARYGVVGETYNIGGFNEKKNIHVVEAICELLGEFQATKSIPKIDYKNLISFVEDRPGHDTRYAVNASKIKRDLGWFPQESFDTGLRKTVEWYIDNRAWWEPIISGQYEMKRIGLNGRSS